MEPLKFGDEGNRSGLTKDQKKLANKVMKLMAEKGVMEALIALASDKGDNPLNVLSYASGVICMLISKGHLNFVDTTLAKLNNN